jgi:hypothetical protein
MPAFHKDAVTWVFTADFALLVEKGVGCAYFLSYNSDAGGS